VGRFLFFLQPTRLSVSKEEGRKELSLILLSRKGRTMSAGVKIIDGLIPGEEWDDE